LGIPLDLLIRVDSFDDGKDDDENVVVVVVISKKSERVLPEGDIDDARVDQRIE